MNIYRLLYFALLLTCFLLYLLLPGKRKYEGTMVLLLLLLWLLTAGTAIYLVKVAGLQNNLFLFHLSTPLEYIILALLYRHAITNRPMRKMISVSIPIFVLLSVLFGVFVQPLRYNNSYIVIIESVLLVFLSLYFLREVLVLQPVLVLNRFPLFWISVAILFYFTGNLVIEGMLNYMIRQSMELARRTYMISYIFKYLLFCLFIAGALCNRRQT